MKILIDCAEIEKIKEMYALYPIEGVTCNPTILKRGNQLPYAALKAIRDFIGENGDLHVQLVSSSVDKMLTEAHHILKRLGKNTYIKVPIDNTGLVVIRKLHQEGINVTATAVYNPMQAYLAALAGADYVAPYVNRIEVLTGNGIETACLIEDIFKKNNLKCQVLGASFKRIDQVQKMVEHGIDASTLSYDLLKTLLISSDTEKAIKDFASDFESLCGAGKTMLDCEGA